MKIHLSLVCLAKNKKETSSVKTLNRPPKLKGVVAKPKYIAHDITGEFNIEMVTTGTEEEIKNDSFYLKRAFCNKKLGGKFSDYKIVSVVHLMEMGDVAESDAPVTEHLKDFEKYEQKEYPAELSTEKPQPVFKFPPLKFSK